VVVPFHISTRPNHAAEIEPPRTVGVMLKPLFELMRRSEPSSSSLAPSILAINGAFTGLALVVVALRVYVRIKILKFAGADDWVIVAAMVRNQPSSNVYLWILSLTVHFSFVESDCSFALLANATLVLGDTSSI
jgi:hypothetical protein